MPLDETISLGQTGHIDDHEVIAAAINALGSGTTGLLAVVKYDPGAFTVKTATSSVVNLDTTNLIAAFTVPANGKALVRFTALVNPETANYYWVVRNASDTELARSIVTSGAGDYVLQSVPFYITGLTPGSLTIRWAHVQASGASQTAYGDTTNGIPAHIEVWSCP